MLKEILLSGKKKQNTRRNMEIMKENFIGNGRYT